MPQGSVLGPLLFLIYLNDLLNSLEKQNNIDIYAFADDLKICSTNATEIQNSLDIITNWSKIWKIKINLDKSEHIRIYSQDKICNNPNPFTI